MLFDTWLESKGIDMKTFGLRHERVQNQMIEEYNTMSRTLAETQYKSKEK